MDYSNSVGHWPPPAISSLWADMAAYGRWWEGLHADTRPLAQTRTVSRMDSLRESGGAVGAVARSFMGRPARDYGSESARSVVHVPLASDICVASADMLFSEAPEVSFGDGDNEYVSATLERFQEIADDGFFSTLAEGAEVAAALGGVYYRVTVDSELSESPFLTVVDYDCAIPTFRFGRMVAVDFVSELSRDEDGLTVWRHLESHTLDAAGNGVVTHRLYRGAHDTLGQSVPLTQHRATAGLSVDAEGASTAVPRTPGLLAVHVPNALPQREWRRHALGRHMGRSDLSGLLPLLDALNETYSSWMRDIRHGKSRIMVGAGALEQNGPGQGGVFDSDREVFTELNILSPSDASSLPIHAQQFQIRYAEHEATANNLVARILQGAGYSAATFGEYSEGAMTATEVRSRERRTFTTRDRKVRIYRPQVSALVRKIMAVDGVLNNHSPYLDEVNVVFTDGVTDSPLTLAQTAQVLRSAQAASTQTLVEMTHPDWTADQVAEEVKRILDESSAGGSVFDDPEMFGVSGAGVAGDDSGDDPGDDEAVSGGTE